MSISHNYAGHNMGKRWLYREERWVARGEVIRPAEFGVDVLSERMSRALILEHHYSGSFPAARLSVGLFRKTGVSTSRVVGTAVFSVPIQAASITRYSGLLPSQGVELGRFVCTPDVAFNGETWFLRRALALLRQVKPEVRAVVSYADPMERRTVEGLLTKAAHAGQIYAAHNAVFAGRAKPRWLWLDRNGQVVSERALSKIRAQHQGHAYAERQLVTAGADPRRYGEEPAAWLERVLRAPTFRRLRHPGNFVFVFGLDRQAKAGVLVANGGNRPYPKVSGPKTSDVTRPAPQFTLL